MTSKVVAAASHFVALVHDSGAEVMLQAQYGGSSYPGFVGTASTLARFIDLARDRFGAYDTAMLSHIVRSRRVGGDEDHNVRLHFYFPGLELY